MMLANIVIQGVSPYFHRTDVLKILPKGVLVDAKRSHGAYVVRHIQVSFTLFIAKGHIFNTDVVINLSGSDVLGEKGEVTRQRFERYDSSGPARKVG